MHRLGHAAGDMCRALRPARPTGCWAHGSSWLAAAMPTRETGLGHWRGRDRIVMWVLRWITYININTNTNQVYGARAVQEHSANRCSLRCGRAWQQPRQETATCAAQHPYVLP